MPAVLIHPNECRPQYDDSAVAVIITKQEKVQKYEKMMSGEEVLESWYVDSNGKLFSIRLSRIVCT